MFRRTSLLLAIVTPLGLCAGLAAAPPAPPPKADVKTTADNIKKTGKLAGANYWRQVEGRYATKPKTVAAVPFQKAKAAPGALAAAGKSSLTVVGDAPPGFGKGFVWDRAEPEALLVLFINAADPLGVSIVGVQNGDYVEVLSPSGIASFSEDKGNPLASSIVGLVATGATVAVGAAGLPEVVPVINAAEKFAQEQFKATNAKTKKRDTFGVDPGSGHKARQEGGILVCLPEAGGTFYSGDGDHKERWIKGDGARTDDRLPAHVFGSFFPRQGFGEHNRRKVTQTAPMYVVPWDWKFEDNAGYYKVFVKLTRGEPAPVVIERKPGAVQPKVKP